MSQTLLLEVAREYFPNTSDHELGWLIWNETGYPAFWDTPQSGATPEDCFRIQLARVVCREYFGEYGYFDSEKQEQLALASGAE